MPHDFFQSQGLLYAADGFTRWLRWDGLTAQAEPAGVDPPDSAAALAASGTGSITGDYYAYVRFVDRLGFLSDPSPLSDPVTAASAGQIDYASVPTPEPGSAVVLKQILRNTAGQLSTFYVDVETADVYGTSFSSTLADDDLAAQVAVPLFDVRGKDLLRLYAVPPDTKAFLAFHLDRGFAAGELAYSEGSALVTEGSLAVDGIGTDWKAEFAGRYLYVVGAPRPCLIASCDKAAQTLTLAEPYAGATDPFAAYSVRPSGATRREVRYSEAGLPESWPAVNAFTIPEDGDEITGLMTQGSFLYILERRHTYRFTAQSDPALDGFVFLAARRGCVNHRCYAQVGDTAYMLDEGGVHAFGGGESRPISSAIRRVFDGSHPVYRINWRASQYFHACHYPHQETVRWFVTMSGDYLPRHAVCYSYATERWWVEEFPRPVGASCLGLIGDPAAGWRQTADQVYLGSDARVVLAFDANRLDGPPAGSGTTRGTATSATRTTLTDDAASFPPAGTVGARVSIVRGAGRGQRRRVASATSTVLTLTQPWAVTPDDTSEYQLGGVPYRWRSRWYRFAESETRAARRVEVLVSSPPRDGYLDVRVFEDYAEDPVVWQTSYTRDEGQYVETVAGRPELTCHLLAPRGFFEKRMDAHRERNADAPRLTRIEAAGVSGEGPLTVDRLGLDGVD